MSRPSSLEALALAGAFVEPIVELTTRLAEVPAPSNDEGDRARALERELHGLGYDQISVDDIHNVTARIPGKDRSRTLVLAGHIDTVFPRDVDLTVTRDDDILRGPGIGDNTVSVACVAFLKHAFEELGVQPAIDIVITGNVGEEGLGDLRGIRRVVETTEGLVGVIAVEGHSLGRITHAAVGSKRYMLTVTGPGGHSWGKAGAPSAIHHLARLIAAMDDLELSKDPKVSFNAGVVHGGISVNTIAPEAIAVLDMRSTDADALAAFVSEVDRVVEMNRPDGVDVQVEVVGDRPAGSLPRNEGLSPVATAVLNELGFEVAYDISSTDANVPISLGIPSICIGLTTGGGVHREDEFIHISPLRKGFAALVLTALRSAEALATQPA